MILAVASGKGGTGKTTLSVSLARVMEAAVQVADCDVEEPNAHLFLPGTETRTEVVAIPVPEVDESLCDGCGECGRFCRFHAIVSFGTKPLVFPELCHGCGGCVRVCPRKAIRETDHAIGTVETSQAGNVSLVHGRLNVGAPMAPPLIRAVKARLRNGIPAILDAPPGTSCAVIATLRGADFVLLVTEPTPFGWHDLKLAVEVAEFCGLDFDGGVLREADKHFVFAVAVSRHERVVEQVLAVRRRRNRKGPARFALNRLPSQIDVGGVGHSGGGVQVFHTEIIPIPL